MFGLERTMVAVIAAGMLLIGGIAFWLWGVGAEAREQGHDACIAKGHDAPYCDERADLYHQRCMDLTYDRGGRFRHGTGLAADRYVECLELGDKEYWAQEARRAAELRDAQKR